MGSTKTVLIAAGGTGGHIYPALAVAEAFHRRRPDLTVEFVGTRQGLENKIVPPRGFKVHHLSIGRLNSNVPLRERILTLFRLPYSLIESFRLLRRTKPVFVLGVGGHASGPLLLVAALLRYPSGIWEPNAMPGMANRLLSRFVPEAWVVFEEAKNLLRSRHIHPAGMPVRREIEEMGTAAGTDSKKFRVLIFGGSQGARGLNTAVVEMIRTGGDWLKHFEFVHQTGSADFERVRSAYGMALADAPVELREYLHDMDRQYARADLVICRSGAATLSELAAAGKPAILIPFPFAADDHQKKNAESLVAQGAAQMIEQKDLTADRLHSAVDDLRLHPEKRERMSTEIRKFHRPHAADLLAGEFIERIEDASR
jgi:UDP-N-acetylglucosamine--N-acetylmuramyl-(pentapeptide) pyrophosphoryl-undecaprenol N-acetylglucosamine transferase